MPPCPNARHYLDRHQLADLVRTYQQTECVVEELGAALLKIAGGVWDRFHFTDDRDEFVGEVVLHLLGNPLRKADPAKNLFGWFTTCAIRYGQKLRDKANSDRRRLGEYARHLVDSREPIPERE